MPVALQNQEALRLGGGEAQVARSHPGVEVVLLRLEAVVPRAGVVEALPTDRLVEVEQDGEVGQQSLGRPERQVAHLRRRRARDRRPGRRRTSRGSGPGSRCRRARAPAAPSWRCCARGRRRRAGPRRAARCDPRRCSTISRSSRPSSVPPGSRDRTTACPEATSQSARSSAWVDLPEPSPPSKVMKSPVTTTRPPRLLPPPFAASPRSSSRAPASSPPGFFAGRLLGSGLLRRSLRLRLRRPLCALVGEQLHGAIEVDLLDRLPARDRRVRHAVGDVGAEPAVLDPDRLAAVRVGVELLERTRCAPRTVLGLGVQLERAGQVDVEDLVLAR